MIEKCPATRLKDEQSNTREKNWGKGKQRKEVIVV